MTYIVVFPVKEIFLVIKIIKKYLKWKIRWRKFYYYWKIIEPYLVVNRFRLSYIWKFIFIFKIQTNISNTWLDITFIYIFLKKMKIYYHGFWSRNEKRVSCPVLYIKNIYLDFELNWIEYKENKGWLFLFFKFVLNIFGIKIDMTLAIHLLKSPTNLDIWQIFIFSDLSFFFYKGLVTFVVLSH